jgi:glycosyltransferase involved in cell wall biosynthesis
MTAGQAGRGRRLSIGVYGARTIPSTYSGYETFLTTLLPQLAARGHVVTMYCRNTDQFDVRPYAGVQRRRLPAIPGKSLNTLSHGLLSAVRARLAGHDVLLVVNVANAFFCAMNKHTGQPVVLNTDGQEWLRGKWGPMARRFFLASANFAPRGANGLVSDCRAMADLYQRDFGAVSTVIPYCAPAVDPSPTRSCLPRYGVRPDDYFIVAGRLNPENNVDAIASAYSRSQLRQPLLVLGAANYNSPVRDRLRRISARDHRIRLVGHVAGRGDYLALVSAATGYVHGHSVGGINPSLVEAMHVGALVVALDTVFNRETVRGAGYLFGQFDGGPLGMAAQLTSVLESDAEDRLSTRRRAAAVARERYDVEDVVDAYEALLIAAAEAPRRKTVTIGTRWAVG